MTGVITRLIQSAATSDLQTSDLSLLRQHKSHLDALALNLKGLSPAIVALDKQKALLAEYKSHLLPWQTAVASQYEQAWKKLVVRLLIITLIICLLIGIGEVSRRLAFRRVQDPNRRRIIGMVHRLLTLFAIAVVALFGVASDLSSLANVTLGLSLRKSRSHCKTSFSRVSAISSWSGSAESELASEYRSPALQAMSSIWGCCNSN